MTVKRYRFRDNGSGPRPRYTLELYRLHPEVPKGTMGRGPYCTGWIGTRAGDRQAAEAKLIAEGWTQLQPDD